MIIVKRDPLKKEAFEVQPNQRVVDYLLAYDHDTDFEVDVYVNNEKLVNDEDFERVLCESDILTISYRPEATGAVIAIAAIVAALVVVSLIPKPETPASVGQTSSSPNNSVSGQTNTVRKYEGIPNIYGRVISYPDLIANSIPEWVNNRKQVRELFLIGEGEYQINAIRDNKTNIADLPDSSATVYGPDTYPSDLERIGFFGEIEGQELVAPDDPSLSFSGNVEFLTAFSESVTDAQSVATGAYIEVKRQIVNGGGGIDTINDPLPLYAGQQVTLTGTNAGTYTVNIYIDFVSGDFPTTVGSYTYTRYYLDSALTNATETITMSSTNNAITAYSSTIATDLGFSVSDSLFLSATATNNGEYEISGITPASGTGYAWTRFDLVEAIAAAGGEPATISSVSAAGAYVGYFTAPSLAEQIWVNLTCPRGIISETGAEISITVSIDIQKIDEFGADIGSPVTQEATFTGKTYEQKGQTVKFAGLDNTNFYKLRAARVTNKYTGSATDYVEINEAFVVNSYSGARFGDVTIIDVVTKTSNIERNTSSRKINVDVTRKLDGVATTSMADAVYDLIVNKGGRPPSEAETDFLYDTCFSLGADLSEFSFTFDDKNISLGEAVQTACNVARFKAYRNGQYWQFMRDEVKPRTYLFNRRNLSSDDNQNQTFKGRQPNDYDSVRLRYYNRDIEDYDDVLIDIDADLETFTVGTAGANPYDIELAGCSNYAQALNRAHLEARKLVYVRWTVEDTALADAANTSIGDRVAWCDIYDGEIFEGEILSDEIVDIDGISTRVLGTSEPIDFIDGVDYYALVTDTNSTPSTIIPVLPIAGNKYAFTGTAVTTLIADNYAIQLGSKYLIGTNADLELYDFSVAEIGESGNDGKINIKLLQYNENIYEMD